MNKIIRCGDSVRTNDLYKIKNPQRINSKIDIYNDATGELIWEPLHNKTVIAGSALTMMHLFNFERNVLEKTPTYDRIMGLEEGASGNTYPTVAIKDGNGDVVASIEDETQRVILGFCVGQGGAGLDASDVFNVPYASWITPDNLVPFRYPLTANDNVDEEMYKGKKYITTGNGQERTAYYFKEFSNTPQAMQNYVSTIGTFTDEISQDTVYSTDASADAAQSFVELHLKITREDCREFFIAHSGIESARINQISLVYGWRKTVTVTKLDTSGNTVTKQYEYYQDVRPFSVVNINSEILSNLDKSISCVYTLYF